MMCTYMQRASASAVAFLTGSAMGCGPQKTSDVHLPVPLQRFLHLAPIQRVVTESARVCSNYF